MLDDLSLYRGVPQDRLEKLYFGRVPLELTPTEAEALVIEAWMSRYTQREKAKKDEPVTDAGEDDATGLAEECHA